MSKKAPLLRVKFDAGEPALSHMVQALESGMNVATTNKGPAALHFPKLLELSQACGGSRIQGILNGTTNYILGEMENGADYADALQDAQAKGYAEADPAGDVDGF